MITNVFTTTGKPDYTGTIITPEQFSTAGFLFGDYYYSPSARLQPRRFHYPVGAVRLLY